MNPAKQRLNIVHAALLRLHKSLLDSERASYEMIHGAIPSPNAFLQLVIHDEWFSWLRQISEFIVEIDIATDAKIPVTPAIANQLLETARKLLVPDQNGQGFAKRYFDAVQRDRNVAALHAATMDVIREDLDE